MYFFHDLYMDNEHIHKKFEILRPLLNERLRRQFAVAEAMASGHGGITIVAEATGVSRRAITAGCKELKSLVKPNPIAYGVRKRGAGRKRAIDIADSPGTIVFGSGTIRQIPDTLLQCDLGDLSATYAD